MIFLWEDGYYISMLVALDQKLGIHSKCYLKFRVQW